MSPSANGLKAGIGFHGRPQRLHNKQAARPDLDRLRMKGQLCAEMFYVAHEQEPEERLKGHSEPGKEEASRAEGKMEGA